MENILDQLYENKNLFIISDDKGNQNSFAKEKISVVINLYYEDTLNDYMIYLQNIPDQLDCHIYSSNLNVIEALKLYTNDRPNFYIHIKNNRGRDISALLVEYRKIAFEYDYFCFLHDKKTKEELLKQDVDKWVRNIWINLLHSKEYIFNIINILKKGRIGFLTPPAAIGEYKSDWYANTWKINFDNTKNLAESINLNCDMQYEKSPFALGTAFWCKTDALRKLMEQKWKYEHFMDEPLPPDGTLSHAIERILPYVAQDAGYESGIVMCKEYAEQLLLETQKQCYELFSFCQKYCKVDSIHQLLQIEDEYKMVDDYFSRYKSIYIYGAGYFGDKFLERLNQRNYMPKGFVISDGYKKSSEKNGLPVYELNEILPNNEVAFFIVANPKLQIIMEKNLKDYHFENYYVVEVY